jgi:superfamily II DNA or RNA helicase
VASIVLSQIERGVSSKVRQRAAAYAHEGAVTLEKRRTTDEPVEATVLGSDVYSVVLRYEDRALFASCSCPYFTDRFEICKHIWATLITCDRDKVAFPGRIEDLLPDDEVDDGLFEHDSHGDFAEEEEEEEEEERPRGQIIPIRRAWTPPSRWRSQIETIRHAAQPLSNTEPVPPEITWVVDPGPTGVTFVVDIMSRTQKKNGEPGKPQPLRIAYASIPRITSPLDREILSIVASADRFYGYLDTKLFIGWPTADYVVPKLVRTGRLWIRTGKSEYERCEAFDDGEPWRLAVRAEEEEGGGKYAVTAALQRGEESRPIRDALAVTRGGFVVFRNSIARFADEGTQVWASILRSEAIEIPAHEIDDFARAVGTSQAPIRIDFPSGVSWQERHVAPRATLDLRDRWGSMVQAMPRFDYDGHAIAALARTRALYDEKAKTTYIRDAAAESRLLDALWGQSFVRQSETVLIPPERLPSAIPKLIEAGWEVRGADGIYAAPGELDLEVTSGIDWFDLGGGVTFGDETVRLPRLLAALRKGEPALRLSGGRVGMIRPEWREQLEPFLASASAEHDAGLRFRRNQVLLLDALLASRPQVSFDEVFDQARRRLLDVRVAPEEPRASFRGTLRPYQAEGLGWFAFLRELGFGGCLADDMGLGKTIQVLALLDRRRSDNGAERRPSLVVAPRSVVFNWKAEAARFTPELRILDHSTPDRIRATDHFAEHDVVLTTYALLRKEAELFANVEFDYAILDEAQAIKNASSQAAKAATLLNARHRLALSGTPVENHLGELASLFEFLNPGMLRAKSSRVMKMLRHAGGKSNEAADARAMLSRAVRPFILRRTKAQVARELPDRVEQTIWCELEPKQRKLYDELRDYYRASLLGRVASKGMNRSKIHILEALLRMRQAACHPALVDNKRTGESSAKLDALFEELPILLDGGHKVLVFSQFTSLLALVRNELRQRGIRHAYLDGASRDREAEVARFQNDPDVPLFLISLKAGGLGLNLTAAGYVFLLDPWWNPAVEAQAIDRAHRIGQTRSVFAYRLVARNTIEEKILELQQSKRDLADAIIGEENSILRQLTEEDLEALLS